MCFGPFEISASENLSIFECWFFDMQLLTFCIQHTDILSCIRDKFSFSSHYYYFQVKKKREDERNKINEVGKTMWNIWYLECRLMGGKQYSNEMNAFHCDHQEEKKQSFVQNTTLTIARISRYGWHVSKGNLFDGADLFFNSLSNVVDASMYLCSVNARDIIYSSSFDYAIVRAINIQSSIIHCISIAIPLFCCFFSLEWPLIFAIAFF